MQIDKSFQQATELFLDKKVRVLLIIVDLLC